MCLSIPGEVQQVHGDVATVDFWGVEKNVRLETVDEPVEPGDYILNHVGFAIKRIPDDEVEETMAMYDEILAAGDDDLTREDVIDELRAGSSPGRAAVDGGSTTEAQATADDADDLLDELGIEL